jgi:hypothetical protein
MPGQRKQRPHGVDTGLGSSIWEPPSNGGRYAFGLGLEHPPETATFHLTDKLQLERQAPLTNRTGLFRSEHPDAVLWDYLGYDSFRDAVLARHIANSSQNGKIPPAPDLTFDELAVVAPGKRKSDPPYQLRKAAAAACLLLLDAARKANPQDTIGIASAYRSPEHDRELWLGYFRKYYWETLHKRRSFFSGPLGPEAVGFMAHYVGKWKAAPGYSNHSKGIAVDFHYKHGKRELKCVHADSSLAAWKSTPFYQWLAGTTGEDGHAKDFGFRPYHPEPWHWEYKP